MNNLLIRHVGRLLVICMAAFPFNTYAGLIGTDQVLAAAQSQDARARLRALVSRSEVRAQLQSRGISPGAAEARVSALTDAEAASLAGQIDSLPAGGVSEWAAAAALIVIGLIWYYWVK